MNEKKVIEKADLGDLVQRLKDRRKKIVMTNGGFEILHPGHVEYLQKAAEMGDVLIVGLNTDESIRQNKGSTRPVNKYHERSLVLSGLSSVDYITPLEEDRPAKLIEIIKPDVYVKGGDYKKEDLRSTPLVESLGGKVVIVPFVGEHSTTRIIKKISERNNT